MRFHSGQMSAVSCLESLASTQFRVATIQRRSRSMMRRETVPRCGVWEYDAWWPARCGMLSMPLLQDDPTRPWRV